MQEQVLQPAGLSKDVNVSFLGSQKSHTLRQELVTALKPQVPPNLWLCIFTARSGYWQWENMHTVVALRVGLADRQREHGRVELQSSH